jgi:hypothetical protein
MENNNHFHGVPPTDEECAKALQELDEALKAFKNRAGSLVR